MKYPSTEGNAVVARLTKEQKMRWKDFIRERKELGYYIAGLALMEYVENHKERE